jgi:2-polyprenyl-3-methyl-5-hydroxy-6-metoxy-1,4-benzoquinol methylase
MQDVDMLKTFYEQSCDEKNRTTADKASMVEFLTTMKYLQSVCPPGSSILDACAGCGIYSFPLAKLGYKVTAGDLVDGNVNQIKAEQQKEDILENVYCGSILDLSRFQSESFDVVLNFGSYYHLINEDDRNESIQECLRVLKKGGVFALAFLNKYSNFYKFSGQWKNNFSAFKELIAKGYSDQDSLFINDSPEQILEAMSRHNLTKLHLIATDGIKFAFRDSLNELDDKTFNDYLDVWFQMCEVGSLLGYSEHCLYIGRK